MAGAATAPELAAIRQRAPELDPAALAALISELSRQLEIVLKANRPPQSPESKE